MLLMSALISGIGLGSMYGLMALGFYVTYAVSGTVNFAQGSSMMLGAVLTFLLSRSLGFPMPVAIMCALLLCAVYGLLVEFIAVRPFVSRGSDSWLMATVALGIVLDNVVMFVFGKEPRSLPSPLAQSSLEIGGVGLGVYPLQVIIPVVGLALAAALYFIASRTRWGVAMLAVAQNRAAARLMGIPITKAIAFAYAISTLFAGIAGVLIAPLFNVHSDMGTLFGLKAFAVAILGGITSAVGRDDRRPSLRHDGGDDHRDARVELHADHHVRARHRRARVASERALRQGGGQEAMNAGRAGGPAVSLLHLCVIAAAAAGASAVALNVNGYYVFVLANVALLGLVGVGMNVLIGLSGQISFGHVGFYAIGAYSVAILDKAGVSFWIAWPAGALFAAAIGWLLALPALRVKGPYLAMITIAFGFIVEHTIVEMRAITGGQNGMMGISAPSPGRAGAGRTRRRRHRDGCDRACLYRLHPAVARRMGRGAAGCARQRAGVRIRGPQPCRHQDGGLRDLRLLRRRGRRPVRAAVGFRHAPHVRLLAIDPVRARRDDRRRRLRHSGRSSER